MAQNVIINGVTYADVPSVQIPKVGSGTASFLIHLTQAFPQAIY